MGDYTSVPKEKLPGKILLVYDLPITIETGQTAGIDYTFLWRGDEVMRVVPNDWILPFYPTLKPL